MKELIDLGYIIAVLLFIVGLKRLSSPATARAGNLLAAAGMGLAIVLTLIVPLEGGGDNNYLWILGGMVIGGVIGIISANRVAMTSMPQMVSIFNGLGGGCAVAISIVELNRYQGAADLGMGEHATTLFALFVGAVAFTGSLLAYGKLQGLINDNTIKIPAPTFVNMALLVVILAGIAYRVVAPDEPFFWAYLVLGISLVYGVTFVLPIGGADMPVVISLLNALTGVAAGLAGIVYDSQVMLVGGILVGASGTILTVLMCEAMNRSLWNVIIGGFGGSSSGSAAAGDQSIREINHSDAAILLGYSESVIVVPGYGMAVAKAQNEAHELEKLLEERGVTVRYAIHPVAGRMPGHMNVLLAEADVSYDKLLDLDDSNNALANTDVVVVVGANDVVNPAANDDPGSPIYGMPILNILQAKQTIVLKRSMKPGYAGIENPLFFHQKNSMLFGDAKDTLGKLVAEVKNLG